MKIWKDEEVVALFEEVETCKKSQGALRLAFSNHAEKFKRKTNSVRNYYYHEVDNLLRDEERCRKLGIDLNNHTKNHFISFDKQEEDKLVETIDNFVKQGLSVRSACLKISNGNIAEMTRIQNKYQNIKKKTKCEQKDNIILFKKRQKTLTENEINSLIMGLVKLIKKTAIEDFMEKTKQEKESSSFLLKKAFVDLNKKDRQIAQLREEFNILKKENQNLIERLTERKEKKNEALKEHLIKNRLRPNIENKEHL